VVYVVVLGFLVHAPRRGRTEGEAPRVLIFWHALLHKSTRAHRNMAVVYLFTTTCTRACSVLS
jgi:hypothetical protein